MSELKSFLIIILIFSATLLGMTNFYGSLISGTQSVNPDGCYCCPGLSTSDSDVFQESTLNQSISDVTIKTNQIKDEALAYHEWGFVGDIVAVIKTGLNSVSLVFDSFNIFQTMISDVVTFAGIPSWLVGIIVVIVLISLVFAFIHVLTGRNV